MSNICSAHKKVNKMIRFETHCFHVLQMYYDRSIRLTIKSSWMRCSHSFYDMNRCSIFLHSLAFSAEPQYERAVLDAVSKSDTLTGNMSKSGSDRRPPPLSPRLKVKDSVSFHIEIFRIISPVKCSCTVFFFYGKYLSGSLDLIYERRSNQDVSQHN